MYDKNMMFANAEYSGLKTLISKSSLFVKYQNMIECDSFVTFLESTSGSQFNSSTLNPLYASVRSAHLRFTEYHIIY